MSLNEQKIDSQTLMSLNLDDLLTGVEPRDCETFASKILPLRRVEGRWNSAQQLCLGFVADVLGMALKADQPNEPYGPTFVMREKRSAIPSDFSREALKELEVWAAALRDPELRARFLDLLWIQAKLFSAAKGAVTAYVESARGLQHPQDWPPAVERLERAVRLSASLDKGGAELKQYVLDEIEAMLRRHKGTDPLYLSLRLIRLLLEFKHGSAHQWVDFAKLASQNADEEGDFSRSRRYLQLAADCHKAAGAKEAAEALMLAAAETLVKESDAARAAPGRGAMVAASFLSEAVDAYRQVPSGKVRAAELHVQLLVVQQEALNELQMVSTRTDVSALIETAMEAVRDKSLADGVVKLCAMAVPPSKAKLKNEVLEQARVAVLGSLMDTDVMNSRGRVVARAPALRGGSAEDSELGLRWRMFQQARNLRSLTVQAMLSPASEYIMATYAPNRQDVVELIQYSPWVPQGHAESLMRALVAGFQGDMLVMGHMVPLQLEALIRHVIELNGGTTSTLEPRGLQSEKSLGTLLEMPEALQAFGEDGVFELQGILVDQLGTNLRNEVAHGLRSDAHLFDVDIFYTWIVLLRMCVLTSRLVAAQRASSDESGVGLDPVS